MIRTAVNKSFRGKSGASRVSNINLKSVVKLVEVKRKNENFSSVLFYKNKDFHFLKNR